MSEKAEYIADLSVLEGLDQPKRHDSGHRMETWEQARARVEQLPEPERAQRLAEIELQQRASAGEWLTRQEAEQLYEIFSREQGYPNWREAQAALLAQEGAQLRPALHSAPTPGRMPHEPPPSGEDDP